MAETIRRQELTRRRLETLLSDLESCPGDWLTVYLPRRPARPAGGQAGLPPGARPSPTENLAPNQAPWIGEIDALAGELDSETGAVFLPASDPATARTGTITQYRPMSMQSPIETV